MNLFKKQSVFIYPERIADFVEAEVSPMTFDNPANPNLDYATECDADETPDFYSVFVVFTKPNGRECIADCATKELAYEMEQMLLMAGKNYIRE